MSNVSSLGWQISVVFENRSDGGLRVYSDDVPGFMLSHPNAELVIADVEPALRTIISEKVGEPVNVKLVGARDNPWFADGRRRTQVYEAISATG